MEDRFKFRVFDKTQKTMGELVELKVRDDAYSSIKAIFEIAGKKICNWFAYSEEYSTAILMQCTGQKDKKGVLIFEGDILRSEVGGNHIWFVTFDDGGFELIMAQHKKMTKKFRRSTVMKTACCADDIALYELVKIGTIHTHPELLEV